MTGSIKVLSIGGAAGATVVGGGTTYLIINNQKQPTKVAKNVDNPAPKPKPSIAQSLPEKQQLLDVSGNDPKWNENWTTFKGEYSGKYATNSSWTFANWDSLQSERNAPEAFKQKCQTNSVAPLEKNDTLLQDVIKFCTKTTV